MDTMIINNYGDLKNIEITKSFIADLTNCSMKDRKRIIDFLSGLTFLNGSIRKINKNQFEIHLFEVN